MLTLRGVTVRYGEVIALDDTDLTVGDGERVSVLGPSGSGKSTLLRAVAGLVPLTSGRVEWNGEDLTNVAVHRRGFGLMFQDYMLFPHMNVERNVRFGLDAAGNPPAAADRRVTEVLELVGLDGYGRRMPAELSGGEQQRVALARALAPSPRLLMLDEPLGALDRSLRRRLLEDLSAIFERLDLPIIYVTHDHEEAMAVGDRVAVINHGRLEAVLPPAELWQRPPSEFVARFLGLTNIVDGIVANSVAISPVGRFKLTREAADGPIRLLIRPDAFAPAADGGIEGIVKSATFRGDHTSLLVATTNTADTATVLEVHAGWMPAPAVGEPVRLSIDPTGVSALPPQASDADSVSRA